MRIGILTFHKAINYGAYLQAFSLSNKLREQFLSDEVEIIDYIAPKEQNRKLYMVLWNVKHYGIKGGISELKRISVFRSMQKYLFLSPKSFCTKNLNKLYSYIDERYDMLIIGSDAVFNQVSDRLYSGLSFFHPGLHLCCFSARSALLHGSRRQAETMRQGISLHGVCRCPGSMLREFCEIMCRRCKNHALLRSHAVY